MFKVTVIRNSVVVVLCAVALAGLSACNLSGGKGNTAIPDATNTDDVMEQTDDNISAAVGEVEEGASDIPDGAVHITGKYTISSPGDYYVDGDIAGKKITVESSGATLYLSDASLSNEKKVIEDEIGCGLTITLIGENSVSNSEDDKDAIDIAGDLVVNGEGSLRISSTKNGISANSITVKGCSLDVDAGNDGLHAEVTAWDDDSLSSQPEFSYDAGGFVYIEDASVSVDCSSDGIQADTFVCVTGDSKIGIRTNGGAPSSVTESSKDRADGKGIKAGAADWGPKKSDGDRTDFSGVTDSSEGYLIKIEDGDIDIDSNDDAVHSDCKVWVTGGDIEISTGDDGMHGDEYLYVSGGNIDITKSYEGLEAAKVEISGGDISIVSTDDGINAADGTTTRVGMANSNCHLKILDGSIRVDSGGDGLDSNGTMDISGGSLCVSSSTSDNDAALDSDGTLYINGGEVLACGSKGMLERPSDSSEQYVIVYSSSSSIAANKEITVRGSSGETILSYVIPKKCNAIIASSASFSKNQSYSIYADGELLYSVTLNSKVNSSSSSGGMPGSGSGGFFGNGNRRP